MHANSESHACELSVFSMNQGGPIYLLITVFIIVVSIIASEIRSKRKDETISIGISLLTQFEALNRLILLAYLWRSRYIFNFCVTGMTMLANVFFAMYMVEITMKPITNQIKSVNSQNRVF